MTPNYHAIYIPLNPPQGAGVDEAGHLIPMIVEDKNRHVDIHE